jgi:hypothetical protein
LERLRERWRLRERRRRLCERLRDRLLECRRRLRRPRERLLERRRRSRLRDRLRELGATWYLARAILKAATSRLCCVVAIKSIPACCDFARASTALWNIAVLCAWCC